MLLMEPHIYIRFSFFFIINLSICIIYILILTRDRKNLLIYKNN